MLVHPDDFAHFLHQNEACLGICEPSTQEPVLVNIESSPNKIQVHTFSREYGSHEWTGLLQIPREYLEIPAEKHVYQVYQKYLPMTGILVRAKEIDTPDDYNAAVNWLKELEKNEYR